MKRTILIGALCCAFAAPAVAQQQPAPVTISGALAQAVVTHLTVGGTISAGQNLAQQIIDASNAPAKAAADEKALRAKIEAEIKAASSGTSAIPVETPPPAASPPAK
jgi:hypothetical protein